MASWSKESVIQFIEAYRSVECLWKIKSKDYSNTFLKDKAYGKLTEMCKQFDPQANRDTISKKINNLRSAFRREFKKQELSKLSGVATEEIYEPKLWYYENLMFLRDQEIPRGTRSNIEPPQHVGPGETDSQADSPYVVITMPKQIPAAVAKAIIRSVRKRVCLYDTRTAGYRNRNITELAWKSVADEVQQDVSYCKSIWASLRATFNRNLANVKNKSSGSGPDKQPKWAFYQHMLFLKDHMSRGQIMTENLPTSQSQFESDCNGGAEESLQFVLEYDTDSQTVVETKPEDDDEDDETVHMAPVPSSSAAPAPAPTSPTTSTASSSPVPDTSPGRKRKTDDPVEQEILNFIHKKKAKSLNNMASANNEQGLAVFGHLLPFYHKLPPLKQMQFLHHISGYLMELYAECHPQ